MIQQNLIRTSCSRQHVNPIFYAENLEPTRIAQSPNVRIESPRTIAIGDIHGCIHALDAILEAINPRRYDTLVCLGDFIDQGRDSRDVIDRLIALQGECRLVTLMGNHEQMLLEALKSKTAMDSWMQAGGFATLNSYVFGAGIEIIPDDHLAFIRGCRDYFESNTHIFTHAGYDADVAMDQQLDYLLRWALLEPPYPTAHCSGKKVVLGHTEQASGDPLDLGHLICIDTACWRHGWLTAMEVNTGELWQASRWGVARSEFANA